MPLAKEKTYLELCFYFGVGLIVYTVQILLYLFDYAERGERTTIDYVLLAALFGLNILLIHKCQNFENWARNVFLVKFLVMAFFFYPQTWFLKGGSWMYSLSFPLGGFQRISNFGNFAYELFFSLYLIKRSVRFQFVLSGSVSSISKNVSLHALVARPDESSRFSRQTFLQFHDVLTHRMEIYRVSIPDFLLEYRPPNLPVFVFEQTGKKAKRLES